MDIRALGAIIRGEYRSTLDYILIKIYYILLSCKTFFFVYQTFFEKDFLSNHKVTSKKKKILKNWAPVHF